MKQISQKKFKDFSIVQLLKRLWYLNQTNPNSHYIKYIHHYLGNLRQSYPTAYNNSIKIFFENKRGKEWDR